MFYVRKPSELFNPHTVCECIYNISSYIIQLMYFHAHLYRNVRFYIVENKRNVFVFFSCCEYERSYLQESHEIYPD